MVKAMYINDCRYDFVDNQGELVYSFKSCNPITFLDIRKLQLASMLKGEWCESFEEISYYLSFLHCSKAWGIGQIADFFELFSCNSEKLIDRVPFEIGAILSFIITKIKSNSSRFDFFFLNGFEKNEFLAQSVEGFHPRWNILERGEIHTILDLVNSTRSDLLHIRNMGSKTVDEIEALLAEKELHLKEENE